ncbi:MAG: NAD(P)-binding protein [Afipia sp.]|nr:NAD(P)-binding protein [Afipia sp.]
MDRPISRRDFLNGVALTVVGAAAAQAGLGIGSARAELTDQYPPQLKNLRGHSEGAMNVGHALRDGTFWSSAGAPEATGETYDLVVVGGGISGLAAAQLFQKHKPGKVLILENNDDFGGHARRNEYVTSAGRTVIGYGGSQSLQTPSYFSEAVHSVLKDIGIELEKFDSYYDSDWEDERELGSAVFFAKEDVRRGQVRARGRGRRRLGAGDAAQRQGQGRPDRTDRRATRLSRGQDARGKAQAFSARRPMRTFSPRSAAMIRSSSPISRNRRPPISVSASREQRRSMPGGTGTPAFAAWTWASVRTRR